MSLKFIMVVLGNSGSMYKEKFNEHTSSSQNIVGGSQIYSKHENLKTKKACQIHL